MFADFLDTLLDNRFFYEVEVDSKHEVEQALLQCLSQVNIDSAVDALVDSITFESTHRMIEHCCLYSFIELSTSDMIEVDLLVNLLLTFKE